MMQMMSKLTISRPPEEVFRLFLAVEESAPDTYPGVKTVVKSPAGPTKAGTTVRFREKTLGGWPKETTMRFISVEPNRKIEFEEKGALAELRATITFDQTDRETTIVLRGETSPLGRFKSISPLVTRQVQRAWERRLARMKTVLEGSAP